MNPFSRSQNGSSNPELATRVKTGVIGGALLLLAIIFGGSFMVFLLTVLMSLAMVYEYSLMVFRLEDRKEKRYVLLCLAWFNLVLGFFLARVEFELEMGSFALLFGYFLWSAQRFPERLETHLHEFALSVLGLVYLVYFPSFLPKIYQSPHGSKWVIVFLLLVFANDTGAYFAGRKWGKQKLYPLISPKKTWEGAWGGLAAGFAVVLLSKLTFFRQMDWLGVLLIPPLVGAVAQVGDFCESLIKRAFRVKDSGQLLPGHGGILDRFDGVVFALPFMYALVRIFV